MTIKFLKYNTVLYMHTYYIREISDTFATSPGIVNIIIHGALVEASMECLLKLE